MSTERLTHPVGRVHHSDRRARTMSDHATTASYTAAGFTTTWGLLTVQEWGIVAGIAIGIATWATNAYYRRQESQRRARLAELDEQIKEAKLEAMRRE